MQPADRDWRADAGAVWVTRAEPGAGRTAARLAALGYAPLSAPLLAVRPLAADLDLAGVAALAFTSANGVAAFAAQSPRRDLPVFAVGDATAAAAAAAGFGAVRSADGDVHALADLIAEAPPAGVVLHPGAREPAADLVAALRDRGAAGRWVPVYETGAVDALEPRVAAALAAGAVGTVLLHSPRAARVLAGLALDGLAPDGLAAVVAVGLSAACLAPLETTVLAGRRIADRPHEDALFAALGKAAPRR